MNLTQTISRTSILLSLYMLSSCTIHNHHHYSDADGEKNSHVGSRQSWSIVNNYTGYQNDNAQPGASTPIQKEVMVAGEKPVIKKIKVGCDKYVQPPLEEPRVLTVETYEKINPKNNREILETLLKFIKDNKEISERNQQKHLDAFDKHLKSCR